MKPGPDAQTAIAARLVFPQLGSSTHSLFGMTASRPVKSLIILLHLAMLATAYPLNPGSALPLLLFAGSACALALVTANSRSYAGLVIGAMLWLGLWLKFYLHLFAAEVLVEPVGQFLPNVGAYDSVMTVSSLGQLAAASAIIAGNRFWGAAPITAQVRALATRPLQFEFGTIGTMWIMAFIATICMVFINDYFGIMKVGLIPKTVLVWPLNAAIATYFSVVYILMIAFLLRLDTVSLRSPLLGFCLAAIMIIIVSVSLLSRGTLFFHMLTFVLPLAVAALREKDLMLIKRLGAGTLLLLILIAGTFGVVQAKRMIAYEPTVSSQQLAVEPEINRASSSEAVVQAEPSPDAQFAERWPPPPQTDAARLFSIVFGRWLGIEGVMVAVASEDRSPTLFKSLLLERAVAGQPSLYQFVSSSPNIAMDGTRFHWASIPGIVGFGFLSGSYAILAALIVGVVIFAIGAEALVRRLTLNEFAAAFVAITITNWGVQLGVTPLQMIPTFLVIAICCIGLIFTQKLRTEHFKMYAKKMFDFLKIFLPKGINEPFMPRWAFTILIGISLLVHVAMSILALERVDVATAPVAIFAVSAFLLTVVAARTKTYAGLMLCVFAWLGLWMKFVTQEYLRGALIEPTGLFDFSRESMNLVALVSATACFAIATAIEVAHCFRHNSESLREHDTTRALSFPQGLRWGALLLTISAIAFVNIYFGILESGLNTQTRLPWPGNAMFAGFLYYFYFVACLLLLKYDHLRGYSLLPGLITLIALIAIVSVSILSRGQVIIHVLAVLMAILTMRIINPKIISSILIVAVCFASVLAMGAAVFGTQQLRSVAFAPPDIREIIVAEEDAGRSGPINNARFAAQSRDNIDLCPDWHIGPSQRPSLVDQIATLAVGRWIGLEGVMVAVGNAANGPSIMTALLLERAEEGVPGVYQHVSCSHYVSMNNERFNFASIPGPAGFFYMSQSFTVVATGIFLFSFFVVMCERFVRATTQDELLTAFIGIIFANIFAQFGLSPSNLLKSLTMLAIAFGCYWIGQKIVMQVADARNSTVNDGDP